MQNYLYKLEFETPVHFGSDIAGIGLENNSLNCHADTFFSALCHEVLALNGESELKEFIKDAQDGNFLISDLFPYNKSDLFLPKPFLLTDRKENNTQDEENSSALKKKMKKLEFIPVTKWSKYIDFLKNGGKLPFEPEKFAESELYSKVSIPRNDLDEDGKDQDNKLYSVGANIFKDNCGLYFIVCLQNEEQKNKFDKIITSLGYSGIGGKRTSGYGKFKLRDDTIELDYKNYAYESDKELAILFNNTENPDYFMAMSCIFPSDKDKETDFHEGFYGLIPRQGFVSSSTYSDIPLKRNPLSMFNSGSCFKQKLEGSIPDVSNNGKHPVYRYGKALMIGITL